MKYFPTTRKIIWITVIPNNLTQRHSRKPSRDTWENVTNRNSRIILSIETLNNLIQPYSRALYQKTLLIILPKDTTTLLTDTSDNSNRHSKWYDRQKLLGIFPTVVPITCNLTMSSSSLTHRNSSNESNKFFSRSTLIRCFVWRKKWNIAWNRGRLSCRTCRWIRARNWVVPRVLSNI